MHIIENNKPVVAARWLFNCYPVHRRKWLTKLTGSQFGSSQKTLSLQRNYTIAQNQSLPFLKIQAKPQRADGNSECNYLQWKKAKSCLALVGRNQATFHIFNTYPLVWERELKAMRLYHHGQCFCIRKTCDHIKEQGDLFPSVAYLGQAHQAGA